MNETDCCFNKEVRQTAPDLWDLNTYYEDIPEYISGHTTWSITGGDVSRCGDGRCGKVQDIPED